MTEGLSREEFEKWARDEAPSLDLTHCENRGDCQRLTFHYFEYATQKAWDAWQAASKQAPQEYEIMDTSSMKREPAEPPCTCSYRSCVSATCPRHSVAPELWGKSSGKQAEPPPSQPAEQFIWSCIICGKRVQTRQDLHINDRPVCVECNAEMEKYVAQSASQASTQPGRILHTFRTDGCPPDCPDCAFAAELLGTSKPDGWVRDPIEPSQQEGHIDSKTKEEWARRIAATQNLKAEQIEVMEGIKIVYRGLTESEVLAILNEGK